MDMGVFDELRTRCVGISGSEKSVRKIELPFGMCQADKTTPESVTTGAA